MSSDTSWVPLVLRLEGFSDISINNGRLQKFLMTRKPFSVGSGNSEKEVAINNLIVLFRQLLWYKEVRGCPKLSKYVCQSLGVECQSLCQIKHQMYWLWNRVMGARTQYLHDKRLDSSTIPRRASDKETCLLKLVDRLRRDIEDRRESPQPSQFALDRLPDRQRAWIGLVAANPKALLVRSPRLPKAQGDTLELGIEQFRGENEDSNGKTQLKLNKHAERIAEPLLT